MREVDLLTRYADIPERLRNQRLKSFELTLGVLDLLDRIPAVALKTSLPRLKWMDFGSCRFEYVMALTTWLTRMAAEKVLPPMVSLTGVEKIDRSVFEGLKSRRREALQEIALLSPAVREKVSYRIQDQAELTESFDAAFWLFPYVRPAQYRLGGLWRAAPLLTLVVRATEKLSPGGLLIAFHLGEAEFSAFQTATPSSLTCTASLTGEKDSLYPSSATVVVSVWSKKALD